MLPPQWDPAGEVATESDVKTKKPPLFKVLLHNDDYTTMEFVVHVLESIFNLPEEDAFRVMLNVHQKGIGVAGVYTYEIAQMKVGQTTALAQANEYPLLCTLEEE
jgi:ATP-dependent Clp protease adaptor protein ClpS